MGAAAFTVEKPGKFRLIASILSPLNEQQHKKGKQKVAVDTDIYASSGTNGPRPEQQHCTAVTDMRGVAFTSGGRFRQFGTVFFSRIREAAVVWRGPFAPPPTSISLPSGTETEAHTKKNVSISEKSPDQIYAEMPSDLICDLNRLERVP